MKLQKLRHAPSDIMDEYEKNVIITHGVNEIMQGGEFTFCGRSIPDAVFEIEGWEAVGTEYEDNITKCNCQDCLKIIGYIKKLK